MIRLDALDAPVLKFSMRLGESIDGPSAGDPCGPREGFRAFDCADPAGEESYE